jgi:hypothetical protein
MASERELPVELVAVHLARSTRTRVRSKRLAERLLDEPVETQDRLEHGQRRLSELVLG